MPMEPIVDCYLEFVYDLSIIIYCIVCSKIINLIILGETLGPIISKEA